MEARLPARTAPQSKAAIQSKAPGEPLEALGPELGSEDGL